MLPRRLALAVAPEEGESFASWVDRMASFNHCPPGVMADLLGLPVRAVNELRPLAYGVRADTELRRAVHAATGVREHAVERMHLAVFDGGALNLADVWGGDETAVRTAGRREWVDLFASRACPQCLAESGGVWQLHWKLSGAGICPEHSVVLLDRCPTCNVPLRYGGSKPSGLSRRRAGRPTVCGSVTGGYECPQALSSVAATEADAGVAELQSIWLRNTAHEARPCLGGEEVPIAVWFAAFRAAVVMIRLGLPDVFTSNGRLPEWIRAALLDERSERGSSGGRYGWGPATAPAAAAFVALIVPVLSSATTRQLAEHIGPLVEVLAARGRLAARPLTRMDLPTVFARAVLQNLPAGARAEKLWRQAAEKGS